MDRFLPIVLALAALGVLGLAFGAVLALAGKKFAVAADERVEKVRALLGGANCGACGFTGCDAFAEAVAKGEAKPMQCPAADPKVIGEALGLRFEGNPDPLVARVRCNGVTGHVARRYDYRGLPSCRAAHGISGGPKDCEFGCLGFGDCLRRCPFQAISLWDGVAHVDEDRCVGCGVCMATCPRQVIHLLPRSKTVVVLCRNKATGKIARLQCKTACVGCRRCEKHCPSEAIHVKEGVALIDEKKCTRCGACAAGCPMHCIHNLFRA